MSKIKAPVEGEYAAKKKKRTGFRSTVYKPFEAPLSSINLPAVLSPIFSGITPNPGYMGIWPDENENIELVDSKYGPVQKGSILSYQQCKPKPGKTSTLDPTIHVPDFKLRTLSRPSIVLNEREQLFYESLSITNDEALKYELQTREQSSAPDWHRLRKHRLTASHFKEICSSKQNFDSLSQRLINGKIINTASVRHGIIHEEEAAQAYSQVSGNGILPVGLIINPSIPHLGSSPDRRVYDPTEVSPWGLLELKCTMHEQLSELNYLKLNEEEGKYYLKKNHAHYYQVMGCLGLSGCEWEDFYVQCSGSGEYHLERIHFDSNLFSEMLTQLNMFYFNFHLPFCVQQ